MTGPDDVRKKAPGWPKGKPRKLAGAWVGRVCTPLDEPALEHLQTVRGLLGPDMPVAEVVRAALRIAADAVKVNGQVNGALGGEPVLRLRLTREVKADIPDVHPNDLVRLQRAGFGRLDARATLRIYEGDDVQMNPHGAVSVRAVDGEFIGVKPGEFEWLTAYGLLEQARRAGFVLAIELAPGRYA